MHEDTKFILRRMEALEGRIMNELKELHAWKNKIMGMAFLAGGVGSILIEVFVKKI